MSKICAFLKRHQRKFIIAGTILSISISGYYLYKHLSDQQPHLDLPQDGQPLLPKHILQLVYPQLLNTLQKEENIHKFSKMEWSLRKVTFSVYCICFVFVVCKLQTNILNTQLFVKDNETSSSTRVAQLEKIFDYFQNEFFGNKFKQMSDLLDKCCRNVFEQMRQNGVESMEQVLLQLRQEFEKNDELKSILKFKLLDSLEFYSAVIDCVDDVVKLFLKRLNKDFISFVEDELPIMCDVSPLNVYSITIDANQKLNLLCLMT